MVWDIFQRLTIAKELSFSEGSIEVLGYRFSMVDAAAFAKYIEDIDSNEKLSAQLYRSTKNGVSEGWGPTIVQKFKFNFNDAAKWWVAVIKLAGWGIDVWEYESETSHKGRVTLKNSTIASYLKGKVSHPCDHIMRGAFAGGLCAAYRADVHVIETECEALGAKKCIFVYDELENLKKKYPELVKQQIG